MLLNLLMRFQFYPRIYAISFKNRILVVYFGTLALARLAATFAANFAKPPVYAPLPALPIDAFGLCGVHVDLSLTFIPYSIGTAFGT